MGSLLASLALLPIVAARRGGGSGSISIGDDGSSLDAPPLQIASLAASSIFAVVTLLQLLLALPHLFRAGVRIPAAGVVAALVIMVVGYALEAGSIVAVYRVDSFGDPIISYESYLDLTAAGNIFFALGYPAMFVAVALVLRSRYRTVQKSASTATIGLTSAASVLVVLTIALAVAKEAVPAATYKAEFRRDISPTEATRRITTASNIFYAHVAFHVVSTIFLAVSAFLVKTRTKNDRVVSLTLFAIVPLLVTHAVALVIFAIVDARLLDFKSGSFDPEAGDAIDFANALVLGLLYVAAMGILVFLLARPRLWSAEERFPAQDVRQPHNNINIVQGVPPAQFPGQWGYPQQQQGPYAQQYVYVPVGLPHNPAMLGTPGQSEKVQTSPQPPRQLPVPPAPVHGDEPV